MAGSSSHERMLRGVFGDVSTVFRQAPRYWMACVASLLLAALLTLYPSTRVSLQLEGPGVFQVFYDSGGGFSEAESEWRSSGAVERNGSLSDRAFRVDPPAEGQFSVCAPTRSVRWLPGVTQHVSFTPQPVALAGVEPIAAGSDCAIWRVEPGHPDPQVVFALPRAPGGAALSDTLTIARYLLWTIAFFALLSASNRVGSVERARIRDRSAAVFDYLDRRLARLFLLVGLVLGIAFIAVRPPGAVPDEFAHASKIALMASGQLIGADDGRERPHLLGNYGPFHQVLGQKFSREQLETVVSTPLGCAPAPREGAAAPEGASPLMYLTPWLAHKFTCSVSGTFGLYYYGAQLGNLALYLLLGVIGLRSAGFGRWVLFFVASLPMSLYLATSLSYDANMLGLCIAYLGIVSGAYSGRIPLSRAQWALLGLGVLLALSKPLMGWIFFAPWICLWAMSANWRHRARWLIASSLVPAALHAIWLLRLTGGGDDYVRPDVASVNGMDALIGAPATYLKALMSTAFSGTGSQILKGVVGVFGWLDIYPPGYFYSIAMIGIVCALALNRTAKPSGLRTSGFAWGVAVLVIVVMCIPFYAFWTQPESPVLEGLQGRYFVPLFGFVVLCSSFSVPAHWRGPASILALTSVPLMSVIALHTILSRYY